MQGLQRSCALLAAAGALFGAPAFANGAELNVDARTDSVDVKPGDGRCATAAGTCTLRAAVQEADAADGASTIIVPAGTLSPDDPPLSASRKCGRQGPGQRGSGPERRHHRPRGRRRPDGHRRRRHRPGLRDRQHSVTAALRDLTITHGDSTAGGSQEINLGGGILNKSGITLERVELVDNKADGGGGMFSIPGTMPTIRDSLITGNSAFEGGGLRIDHGATIVNTTITTNTLVLEPGCAPGEARRHRHPRWSTRSPATAAASTTAAARSFRSSTARSPATTR